MPPTQRVRGVFLAGDLALSSCSQEAPPEAPEPASPSGLLLSATDGVAAIDKLSGRAEVCHCTACHIAPASADPALADLVSEALREFFGGFSSLQITTTIGRGESSRGTIPGWGPHRLNSQPERPGFHACVAVLREVFSCLDCRMPRPAASGS